MAGRGPAPKPANLRQRTNRKATAATLELDGAGRSVPNLPNPDGRYWHRLTKRWWKTIWSSPMAAEWLDSDVPALAAIAVLYDEFYCATKTKTRLDLMREIRLQEARFGLSPKDRAHLHWEVARGGEAERKRRSRAKPKPAQPDQKDPRRGLKAI